jgi:hypothetical protein
MPTFPLPAIIRRLGLHYFPDTHHYRQRDLDIWLPRLRALGAAWLTLIAPPERAIPEGFVRGLLQAGIEPLLHFHLPLVSPPHADTLKSLFAPYARWGVRYAALFDRPNLSAVWSAPSWARTQLVERFIDIYLPLAEAALQAGLTPVLPPLEPGGDYWDTAFLRAALRSLGRRASTSLQKNLVLSAYAWTGNRPLNWGAGGPERWPGARPYLTPDDEQDQRGFRIFDWYLALGEAECLEPPQIVILRAGSRPGDSPDSRFPPVDLKAHAGRNMALIRLLAGETGLMEPIHPQVLACCFWLLATDPDHPAAPDAWFQPDGQRLPIVEDLLQARLEILISNQNRNGIELATTQLP